MPSKPNLKYLITNFGCQMNYADGERFAAIIQEMGYEPGTKLEEADLLVLNSCSVRQKAEDRILGLGRIMTALKEHKPELKIVLTGCMARRSWQDKNLRSSPLQKSGLEREQELKEVMPWVDLVLESKDFHKLPELLGKPLPNKTEDYLSFKPKNSSSFRAYVPISVGCDHFCTYCIVPFARGQEICRDAASIITEVTGLVERGFKDITLLGQTVNRWINPRFDAELKQGRIANTRITELNTVPLKASELEKKPEPRDFLQLLQILDELPGDFWLTFMSSHPNYMTPELITFMSTAKHIRPYIHFALQSGSDEVLKRMNRRYNVAEFMTTAKLLKQKIPGLGLSTDIIVGFPGETGAQFQETAKVMQELEFDMAFLSEFSARKGTAAALIPDDVSRAEKGIRKKYLNDEVLAVSALANNSKMIGNTYQVLIEDTAPGRIMGRTGNYKEVRLETGSAKSNLDKYHPGQFVQVRITAVTPWALRGIIC
jgi:tRNA-2-methylthio-N6-dimethylallyladenosine synthase